MASSGKMRIPNTTESLACTSGPHVLGRSSGGAWSLALRLWTEGTVPLAEPPEDLDRGWYLPPRNLGFAGTRESGNPPPPLRHMVSKGQLELMEQGKPSVRALPAPNHVCTHITPQGKG